jgi:DDE superfamily endonuclease/Helix-turn-helix of DDE superfamily endonuclease
MTGLSSEQVDRLVADVYAHADLDPAKRRVVGPYRSVLVVLIYLRHNLSQALVAELFGCSQPTVSRLIGRLAPTITTVLTPGAEHRAERELRSTVRVDGFLAPIGDRRENTYTSGMYSGKRHRCGFNVQVVGSAYGTLVLVGTPQPGAMHDAKAWHDSGLAAAFEGRLYADGGPGGFADTAYTATGLCTPRRKPAGQDHTESARQFNRAIASRRASVERVIAHLKNWKLLATGYRGLLDRFPIFLDTIAKLEIYRTS